MSCESSSFKEGNKKLSNNIYKEDTLKINRFVSGVILKEIDSLEIIGSDYRNSIDLVITPTFSEGNKYISIAKGIYTKDSLFNGVIDFHGYQLVFRGLNLVDYEIIDKGCLDVNLVMKDLVPSNPKYSKYLYTEGKPLTWVKL